jgi:hypothetical protein
VLSQDRAVYLPAKSVAERADATASMRSRVREIAARYRDGNNLVAEVLRRELDGRRVIDVVRSRHACGTRVGSRSTVGAMSIRDSLVFIVAPGG